MSASAIAAALAQLQTIIDLQAQHTADQVFDTGDLCRCYQSQIVAYQAREILLAAQSEPQGPASGWHFPTPHPGRVA